MTQPNETTTAVLAPRPARFWHSKRRQSWDTGLSDADYKTAWNARHFTRWGRLTGGFAGWVLIMGVLAIISLVAMIYVTRAMQPSGLGAQLEVSTWPVKVAAGVLLVHSTAAFKWRGWLKGLAFWIGFNGTLLLFLAAVIDILHLN